MSFTPQPSTADLAQRLGASAQVCEIVSSTSIAPHVREVVLQGNARELVGRPGQDVMVRVETPEGRYLRRRYSVRSLDDDADRFTLWVTTGHQGPGSRWATTAIPGDHLDVVGPRGKIFLDAEADWHLFVGDTSALAAAYRLAGSIEPPGQALFVIEVDDPDDALTTTFSEGVAVTGVFVERAGRAPGDPTGVLRALAAVEFPPGADLVGHAYLFGEASVMRQARTALLDRAMSEERIDLKAYWRSGRANQDHGEPDKE